MTTGSKLISVIIPAYNVEKYLDRCIKSIVKQTYSNLEILIIDDGSTDSTGEIADQLATTDKRIIVIHKDNGGLGYARNTGIEHSRGSYLTFVDSDDFVALDFIEKSVNLLEKQNADCIITSYYRYSSSGKQKRVLRNSTTESIEQPSIKNKFIPRLFGSLPNSHDTFAMSAWGTLYSSNILREYKLLFDSEREIGCEDITFNMRYLYHSNRIVLTEYCGYFYCENANSLTTSYKPDRIKKHQRLYDTEKMLVDNMGLPSDTLLRLQWQYFIHLNMAISQENVVNGICSKKTLINIKSIVSDQFTRKIIAEYPIGKMDIMHRIYMNSVKYRWTIVLSIITAIKGRT